MSRALRRIKRAARDIYVVSIPRGEFPRSWSRAAISRYIRDRVSGFPGTALQGVKVWPETRDETARIAAAFVIGTGGGGGSGAAPQPSPGGGGFPAVQKTPPRRAGRSWMDRRTGAAPQTTRVPARRKGDKVRTHVRRRPVARKRP